MFNTYHSDLCTIFMRLSLGLLLIVYPIGWAFLLYFSYFSSYLSFIPMYIIYEIIGAVVLIIAGIILFLAGLFCVYVLPHIVVFLAKLSLQIGGKVYRLILRK
uniref:Uncharacterized protein n=1 Tax=Euplotes harpa TaxID=151035 RepID=A0A7S3J413_9SPIT|mmetsp:Transcript_18735/g.21532  ORF Transcript_18735/g.21532 Transcript_18735/m.21532 type:complete len:103 (+) Transcript_18735:539-847(+)